MNRLLYLVMPLLLAACQTTGDPRQGGLFGWSESQARERAAALEQQRELAAQDAMNQQGRVQESQTRRSDSSSQVARLKTQLERLLAENSQLDAQLRELMRKRQLGSSELAHLNNQLVANQRLIQQVRERAAKPGAVADSAQLDTLDAQNRRMQDTMLNLLRL